MKALLVTGGFIDDGFTLDYIKKENYDVVFAVDSGLEFFYRTDLIPDYIVGDFDSVEDEILEKYSYLKVEEMELLVNKDMGGEGQAYKARKPEIIRLTPMKDDTDTQHALNMAIDMGCTSVDIFGATGTRLDHVLGNLQLLGYGLRQNVECKLIDPHNRIRLLNKETMLDKETQFGEYISLIPYTPQVTGITLEGFLYPLENYTMSCFYIEDAAPISGVSNEIVDSMAKISLDSGILVLVESRD